MEKIYFNGDSFTEGYYFLNDKQSQYNVWPYLLCDLFPAIAYNDALSGSSNYRIVRTTFETVPKNDFLKHIIGFTSFERVEIPGISGYQKILPGESEVPQELVQLYYKHFYNKYNLLDNFLNQIITLQNYFCSTRKEFYFFNCFNCYFEQLNNQTIQTVIDCDGVQADVLYKKFDKIDAAHWILPLTDHLVEWYERCGFQKELNLTNHFNKSANLKFANHVNTFIN